MAQKSIFQQALNVFRKDVVRGTDDRVLDNAPNNYTPSYNNPTATIEKKQQEFLDWQVNSINKDIYTRTAYFDTDRVSAYQDFRAMDNSPEIAAALSIIRDECLVRNERGNILEIYSQNPKVKEILKDLFIYRLNVEMNLRLWIRELCKYGDFFLHLHIDGEHRKGIYDVMAMPAEEIHRQEGVDGIPGNTRFWWDTKNMYFEDWQVAHFRLIEDVRRLPYGRGILDPARKLWKQLQLAEDAMLVYRITRAPERRVYYIDVGNIDDADVRQYIEKMKTSLKKQPIVDMRTGQMNLKFNPATVEDDYFIPIRGDKSSRIETLPGAANMSEIEDIEYLEKKLFAALQVPKPYLNYTESMPGGSMLAQADLRFARMINSVQESVVMELRRIANVHLLFMGYEDDLDNFTLALTNPSTQQELLNLETWKTRLEVFKDMYNGESTSPASYTWAMENILGFSKEEIKLMLKQKKIEKKLFSEIETSNETYKKIGLFDDIDKKFEDPSKLATAGTGGGEEAGEEAGGDLGGDLGGGGGGGGFDLGGGAGGLELGGPEAGGETPEAGGEAPAPEAGGEEALPLAERKSRRKKDVIMEGYLTELLGESETERKEDSLSKNNYIANTKTYKLKKSMEKFQEIFDKRKVENQEVKIDENNFNLGDESSLLKSNDNLNQETRIKLNRISQVLNRNRNKDGEQ